VLALAVLESRTVLDSDLKTSRSAPTPTGKVSSDAILAGQAISKVMGELKAELDLLIKNHAACFFGQACFAAETPLLVPGGSRAIEDIRVGDLVLSRDEFDVRGEVRAKVVEEVFERFSAVWELRAGGQVILTTGEHPFFRSGEWVAAKDLQVGDKLTCQDGSTVTIEGLRQTDQWQPVYNLRIADYHTYFVGDDSWGWAVWAHNSACETFSCFEGRYAAIAKSNSTNKDRYWTWYQRGAFGTDEIVLGRQSDVAQFKDIEGIVILNATTWDLSVNKWWLQGAIDAHRPILLASDPYARTSLVRDVVDPLTGETHEEQTVYSRELKQLKAAGYKIPHWHSNGTPVIATPPSK
jgi:Pretoxin HINT domain